MSTAVVVGTLALYLVLSLIYNSATPIFEASDEFRHYLAIRYILLNHQLPILQSSDDPFAPWQEAGQPPLYYLGGALLSSWIDTSDLAQNIDFNPHAQAGIPSTSPDSKNLFVHSATEDFPYHGVSLAAHLVRLLSILMGAATVYLTFRLTQRVAPAVPAAALLAPALVAFNPQFLFVSASVDNDNLITLAATGALLLLAQILVDGLTQRRLWLLSGTLGAAMLAKLSGLGLPPLAAIVVGAQTLKRAALPSPAAAGEGRVRVPTAPGRLFLLPHAILRRLLVLAAGPAAIAGWWLVRNWLIYGEPTGLRAWGALIQARAPDALQVVREIPGLFISYWGVFGAFDIQADAWVYLLYLALCLAGVAGMFVARKAIRAELGTWQPLLLLAAWFAIELAALARWTTIAAASTGRLLFPGIAAAAVILAIGLLGPLGEAWRWPATLGLTVVLVGVAAYLPFRYIFPAYARPSIATSAAAIGQPSRPAGIDYGGKLALLGYDLSSATARPGDDLTVRLYWHVLDGMDRNYSVTVQLLTGEGSAGQYDSFPGQGRIATRRLRPGQYFADAYTVRVASSVSPPLIARVKVGLYDDKLSKLPARDASGVELAEPVIGELPIAGPVTPAAAPLASFGDDLALLAGSPDRERVSAGRSLRVQLRWRAQRRMAEPYTVFVHLADESGRPIAQHDSQPRDGAFPTTWWAPGEIVNDHVSVPIPVGTSPGTYQLLVGAYDLQTLKRLPASTGGDAYKLGTVALTSS